MKKENKKPSFETRKQPKEFDDSVLEIRRVTRVVSGGKRMSFRAVVAIGDRKGRVGVGVGKGSDVANSIREAKNDAKKNLIKINLKDNRTIPYDVENKYGAAKIRIKPVPEGHGLIAGGAARIVLDLVGVKDITAKLLGGSNNKLNNAMATITALKEFKKTKEESENEEEKEENKNE
jgi:small subunit ribosomal protein S5